MVYTRWGRSVCPENNHTQLVYSGIVAGSAWNKAGGGVDYLCAPKIPKYLKYRAGVQGYSILLGTEYEIFAGDPLGHVFEHNAAYVQSAWSAPGQCRS